MLALCKQFHNYRHLEKYQQAVENYSRAIQLKPSYPEAYSHRGYAYQQLKQIDKALADYNKAIEIDFNSKQKMVFDF